MIIIRKVIIYSILTISIFSLNNVYIKTNAETKDMFSVFKVYAESSLVESEHQTIVLDEGLSYEEVIQDKINEKYLLAVANKEKMESLVESIDDDCVLDDNTEDKSDSVSVEKYPNQSSYFAGTTDFTDLFTSKRDATLNAWSAIRSSYDSFDDGGEDNITIIATAYTSAAEENGGYEGMNAIGGSLGPGCIAAPKDIPFQTKIRISGLGVFNVEDRGGAIVRVNENTIRVDVWMNSYREAMKFGKRVYKGRIIPN